MTVADVPADQRIHTSDLDDHQRWVLFDPSPEAQIEWIESLLTIESEQRKIVKFKLYPQQRQMIENATGRDITVKGRQTRASSLILARNLRTMTTNEGLKCLVMTQDDQTTGTFRARIKHHLNDLAQHGLEYTIGLDNDDELEIVELENRYIFGSGQEAVAGRAYTGHIVHLSEFAHWPDAKARTLLGAIEPAVPGYPHGQFDIESTPNGAEGMFFDKVMESRLYDQMSRWMTLVYPWWIEPRYRAGTDPNYDMCFTEERWLQVSKDFMPDPKEEKLMHEQGLNVRQLIWRRIKKKEQDKTDQPFSQEFPESIEECFIAAGGNYFASPDGVNHLEQYRQIVRPPLEVRESLPFRGGNVSFHGPNFHIWQHPIAGQPYVLWVDCAGGGLDEQSDFSAVTVLNALSMVTAARLNIKAAPDEIAPMATAIASWYNEALLGGERDAYGSTCVSKIQEYFYPNLWYFIDPTKPPVNVKAGQRLDPWAHPNQTRNPALSALRERVFSSTITMLDSLSLQQMGSFTWQKVSQRRHGDKAAAKPGQKDDLVICWAGCCYLAEEARARYNAKERKPKNDLIVVGAGGIVHSHQQPQVKTWLR
jgi:hypothetical protein